MAAMPCFAREVGDQLPVLLDQRINSDQQRVDITDARGFECGWDIVFGSDIQQGDLKRTRRLLRLIPLLGDHRVAHIVEKCRN
jgi:hypothetical protein